MVYEFYPSFQQIPSPAYWVKTKNKFKFRNSTCQILTYRNMSETEEMEVDQPPPKPTEVSTESESTEEVSLSETFIIKYFEIDK